MRSTVQGGPINPINILSFGAKGDGVTDNTDIIRNAVAYASSSGVNKLFIPSGIFTVVSGINLPDNFTVFGSGDASVLQLQKNLPPIGGANDSSIATALFQGRRTYGDGDSADSPDWRNSSKTTYNVTIKNLKIDLQRSSSMYDTSLYPMQGAIRLFNAVNCLIENVTVINPWAFGIYLKTTVDGTETKNNIIRNCRVQMQEWYVNGDYQAPRSNPTLYGIQLDSFCNYSTANGAACYDMNGSPSPPYNCNSAAKITRNLLDGSYTPSRTYNNTITNCTISNGSHCIGLFNASSSIVTYNTVDNGSNRGIAMGYRSEKNIASYNTISNCGSAGILLSYNSCENTASYNTISSVRGGEGEGIAATVNSNNNLIEYNTISSCPQAGIRVVHGPLGNIIRNNTISGTDKTDTSQKGISLLANWLKYYCLDALRYNNALRADNNTITSNTISNVYTGIYMGDEKNFGGKLSGNTVSSNTYTNVTTNENLNVTFYTRPDGSTSTDRYFNSTACPTSSI